MAAQGGLERPCPTGTGPPPTALVCLNPALLSRSSFEAVVSEARIHRLGRHPMCDVRIVHADIAAIHARLVPRHHCWRLAAVASVTVNGQAQTERDLYPGDVVDIGPVRFRIVVPPPTVPTPDPPQDRPWRLRAGTRRTRRAVAVAGAALLVIGGLRLTGLEPALPAAGRFDASPLPGGRAPMASYEDILVHRPVTLRVVRYRDNPMVLVLDFETLRDQGLALNRIAALVEGKGAPRHRPLNDLELDRYLQATGQSAATFNLGHNYRITDLSRFFSLAEAFGTELNGHEVRLRDMLLGEGVMTRAADRFRPAEANVAVISIPGLQADDPVTPHPEGIDAQARHAILMHELSHGEYFTRPEYRDWCRRFWTNVLTAEERERIHGYLLDAGYDVSEEDLVVNEMQAYLFHTPDPRMFHAGRIGMTEERLAALRDAMRATAPPLGFGRI